MDAAMERLLTMSLQGALLIAGLLLLMRIFRRRLPQWLPYAAWLLPALRLLIPFSMAPRPWSPTGLVQEAVREVAPPLSLMTVALPPAAETSFAPAAGHAPAVPAPTAAVSLLTVLFWLWVAGMAVTFLYASYVNIRFARNLGPRERIACSGCPLPVYRTEGVSSPCLYGLFRPRILLSASALKDGEVAAMAIAHELAHYARRDHWTALLRGLCCIVHWFNPLVWFAAARARQDCELACDERAMKALDRDGRERYGLALIELVAPGPRPLMAGGTAMSGNKGRLRERIAFIGRQPSVRRWAMVAALLIALPLCLLCCAEAPASLGIIGGADGPTAIFVTGGGETPQREPYTPVLASLEGEGWPSFASVMGEEIPYIALGTEIRLDGENLIVKDYLLSEDGRVRYQDGQGGPLGQEIALERDENGLFFLLPGNMATALSSDSADYAPGAAVRGFLVTDGEGNSLGFVLRTDPSFLIEESSAESVGIIGGADGPTSIFVTREDREIHEGASIPDLADLKDRSIAAPFAPTGDDHALSYYDIYIDSNGTERTASMAEDNATPDRFERPGADLALLEVDRASGDAIGDDNRLEDLTAQKLVSPYETPVELVELDPEDYFGPGSPVQRMERLRSALLVSADSGFASEVYTRYCIAFTFAYDYRGQTLYEDVVLAFRFLNARLMEDGTWALVQDEADCESWLKTLRFAGRYAAPAILP